MKDNYEEPVQDVKTTWNKIVDYSQEWRKALEDTEKGLDKLIDQHNSEVEEERCRAWKSKEDIIDIIQRSIHNIEFLVGKIEDRHSRWTLQKVSKNFYYVIILIITYK